MMRIGYTRIVRNEQNADMQVAEFKQLHIEKLFEDKKPSKDGSRPRLQSLLEFVRSGDVVYVESISRLARSSVEFLELANQLMEKKVSLVCLKEGLDSTTPEGKQLFFMLKTLIQLDQNAAKERRQEGIDIALAKNKPYGRPKIEITETFISVYQRWKAGEITAVQAMQLSGLKKNTFYNRVKEFEQARATKKPTWGIRIN